MTIIRRGGGAQLKTVERVMSCSESFNYELCVRGPLLELLAAEVHADPTAQVAKQSHLLITLPALAQMHNIILAFENRISLHA